MEIKYEAVFGPQELFDCASYDAVLAIKDTTSGRIHIFTNDGWIKSGLKHERHIGTSDNQIAMRRIIRTPIDANTYSESKFEEELESIYWHFDSQRKSGSLSERDVFKGTVRYLLNQFMQPARTPTWTVADQKAGRLPEVGCRIYVPVMLEEQTVIYSSEKVIVSISDNGGAVTRTEVGSINRIKPIETPEEKASRLREEWCSNALNSASILSGMREYDLKRLGGYIGNIYDALLSGELTAPKGGE